jgi:EAL and modified HD-GYP domain-containing signal transduction protein
MFNYCQALGCDLFQGYFFCRPDLGKGHVLDANRRASFDLIRELYQPEADIEKISAIVKRDVVLSYKLLKLVNSSFYRRAQQIDSIGHAVMLLGIHRIRSWATLVSLGKLNQKPDELQKESLIRAYMCEKLTEDMDIGIHQMAFSAGLLSCLDAWFDTPLSQLLDVLPLSSDLHDAVVEKTGAMGKMLSMVIDYTHSIWSELDEESMAELSLTIETFSDAYAFAIEQTDQISALMIEE